MPGDAATMDLLKEMKEQVTTLMSKVEALQQKQTSETSPMVQEGKTTTMRTYPGIGAIIEVYTGFFGGSILHHIGKHRPQKRVDHVGVPNCDSIRCPKLDLVSYCAE